jgi:hypothetical protein
VEAARHPDEQALEPCIPSPQVHVAYAALGGHRTFFLFLHKSEESCAGRSTHDTTPSIRQETTL